MPFTASIWEGARSRAARATPGPGDLPLRITAVRGHHRPHVDLRPDAIHRPELEVAGQTPRMLVDQIRSIDTEYVVGDPVDYLSHEQMAEVELALARYLGIHGVTNTRA